MSVRIEGYVCLVDDHGEEILQPDLRAETAFIAGVTVGGRLVEIRATLESAVSLRVPDGYGAMVEAAEFRDHHSVAYYRWPIRPERAIRDGDVVALVP